MKNKYQIILFIVFLLLPAGFSFILISEKRLKDSQKSTSNKPFKEPSLSLPKEDKGLFYANLELELRDKRINNNYPQSLLFAI